MFKINTDKKRILHCTNCKRWKVTLSQDNIFDYLFYTQIVIGLIFGLAFGGRFSHEFDCVFCTFRQVAKNLTEKNWETRGMLKLDRKTYLLLSPRCNMKNITISLVGKTNSRCRQRNSKALALWLQNSQPFKASNLTVPRLQGCWKKAQTYAWKPPRWIKIGYPW